MEDNPSDLELLQNAINKAWTARYEGGPVYGVDQLVIRITKIAEDRDCWLANSKSAQKEYTKLENLLQQAQELVESDSW